MMSIFKGKVMGMDREDNIAKANMYDNLFRTSGKIDFFGKDGKDMANKLSGWTREDKLWKTVKPKNNLDSYFKVNKNKNKNLNTKNVINKLNQFTIFKRPKQNNEINVNNIIGTTRKNKFDVMALTRVKQQKRLPLFGNIDGDKVLNILDCQPFNRKKHGTKTMPIDTNFQGTLSQDDDVMEELEEELSKREEAVTPEIISPEYTVESDMKTMPEQPVVQQPGLWTRFRKAVGIPTLTEVAEEKQKRRDIYAQAYSEAAKKAGELKAEAQFRKAYLKELAEKYPEAATLRKRYVYGPTGELIPLSTARVVRKKRYMDEVMFGLGAASQVLTTTQPTAVLGQRISNLYGMGSNRQAQAIQSTTPSTTSGLVWSPYSKRYVRYPRGPYKKY